MPLAFTSAVPIVSASFSVFFFTERFAVTGTETAKVTITAIIAVITMIPTGAPPYI